jgi:hypothetical protein
MQSYFISWIGNTIILSFTECNYRDSLMNRMLLLISILIVCMFYWLCAENAMKIIAGAN